MRVEESNGARKEQHELEALHLLDEQCVLYQRAGNYLKAFDCMERALVLRRHFFGVDSDEVVQACRSLADMCNLLAMSFLQQDNYAVTLDLLKKAEVLTQRHHSVERATTLNNFACYYRRLGKLHAAMSSLKRALKIEKKLNNTRNAADTHLNICAVLSQLGKHQEALEHAQEAIVTLQTGFSRDKQAIAAIPADDTSSAKFDQISALCIAYHNLGVELEFLKDYTESVASYKKGITLAEQYLGKDHSITTTIRNSFLAAKRLVTSKVNVKLKYGQKSAILKSSSRLLLSPPSGLSQLRLASPLTKEKELFLGLQISPQRFASKRSLPKVSLSVLPPLDYQNLPSASLHAPIEVKSLAPKLSPIDPFSSLSPEDKTATSLSKIILKSSMPIDLEARTPASNKVTRSTSFGDSSNGRTLLSFEEEVHNVPPSGNENSASQFVADNSVHSDMSVVIVSTPSVMVTSNYFKPGIFTFNSNLSTEKQSEKAISCDTDNIVLNDCSDTVVNVTINGTDDVVVVDPDSRAADATIELIFGQTLEKQEISENYDFIAGPVLDCDGNGRTSASGTQEETRHEGSADYVKKFEESRPHASESVDVLENIITIIELTCFSNSIKESHEVVYEHGKANRVEANDGNIRDSVVDIVDECLTDKTQMTTEKVNLYDSDCTPDVELAEICASAINDLLTILSSDCGCGDTIITGKFFETSCEAAIASQTIIDELIANLDDQSLLPSINVKETDNNFQDTY